MLVRYPRLALIARLHLFSSIPSLCQSILTWMVRKLTWGRIRDYWHSLAKLVQDFQTRSSPYTLAFLHEHRTIALMTAEDNGRQC
ncbi:hypothetical protein P692DRAFT_20533958 [Suillus brevipes Sb2]|nr:hypothetical protein P692DRAFT_20533958 [Suillus brevipes Sb2]